MGEITLSVAIFTHNTPCYPRPPLKKLLRKSCLQRESIKNFYGKLGGGVERCILGNMKSVDFNQQLVSTPSANNFSFEANLNLKV